MIPSPKVATYDKEPKMSVQGVADKVAEIVKKGDHEFVMCNFAPPDMVSLTFPSLLSQFIDLPLYFRSGTLVYTRQLWKLSHIPMRLSAPCTRLARRQATYCLLRPTTVTRSR